MSETTELEAVIKDLQAAAHEIAEIKSPIPPPIAVHVDKCKDCGGWCCTIFATYGSHARWREQLDDHAGLWGEQDRVSMRFMLKNFVPIAEADYVKLGNWGCKQLHMCRQFDFRRHKCRDYAHRPSPCLTYECRADDIYTVQRVLFGNWFGRNILGPVMVRLPKLWPVVWKLYRRRIESPLREARAIREKRCLTSEIRATPVS